MNVIDKHRNLLWLIAAIIAAVYFAPSFITAVWQIFFAPPPAQHKRTPFPASAMRAPLFIRVAAPPDATRQSASPAPYRDVLILPDITGVWVNSVTVGPGITATAGRCLRFDAEEVIRSMPQYAKLEDIHTDEWRAVRGA